MRFHLLSLPHTQVTSQYLTCAYTQKVRKFCQMMQGEHDVFLYAGDECDVEVTEHISCIDEDFRSACFGRGFDTVRTPFEWDAAAPYWALFNLNAQREMGARLEQGDFILMTTSVHSRATEGLLDRAIAIEWGVGYEGVTTDFAIFESYAWMHHVYGLQQRRNGRAFDDVVPNFFNPDDFYVSGVRSPYVLFIGRMIQNKGPHVASLIAERAGLPLICAGPGASQGFDDEIVCDDGTRLEGAYIGEVGAEQRSRLMAEARAVIVPTLYLEPFGGVAVEAMLSGTPVVASDWGAFTETVTPDVGRRFRTLQEGVDALEECYYLDAEAIRQSAEERFSLEAIRPQYETAFSRYWSLWDNGWYA